jgi:hypothetical protein
MTLGPYLQRVIQHHQERARLLRIEAAKTKGLAEANLKDAIEEDRIVALLEAEKPSGVEKQAKPQAGIPLGFQQEQAANSMDSASWTGGMPEAQGPPTRPSSMQRPDDWHVRGAGHQMCLVCGALDREMCGLKFQGYGCPRNQSAAQQYAPPIMCEPRGGMVCRRYYAGDSACTSFGGLAQCLQRQRQPSNLVGDFEYWSDGAMAARAEIGKLQREIEQWGVALKRAQTDAAQWRKTAADIERGVAIERDLLRQARRLLAPFAEPGDIEVIDVLSLTALAKNLMKFP